MYPSEDQISGRGAADPQAENRRETVGVDRTAASLESRYIPPHAAMGADEDRARPGRDEFSTGSRLLLWGGIALGVAGLTAGTILATRKVAGLMAEDPPRLRGDRDGGYRGRYETRGPGSMAPRFADLDEAEREEVRRRVRAQAREDARAVEQSRAEASRLRGPAPRKSMARDLTETANDLSASLTGIASSVATAFEAFRGVAAQASGILGEFAGAADQLRTVLHGSERRAPEGKPPSQPQAQGDDPRYHRL